MPLLSILSLFLGVADARAAHVRFDGAAAVAEVDRLREEMALLARRNVWTGVERTYDALVSLGATATTEPPLRAVDHWNGAQAAAARGDLSEVKRRLHAALATGDDLPGVREWLGELARRSGEVELRGFAVLEALDASATPDAREAVAFAQRRLSIHGRFVGLLPAGRYRLGTTAFTVEAAHPGTTRARADAQHRSTDAPGTAARR